MFKKIQLKDGLKEEHVIGNGKVVEREYVRVMKSSCHIEWIDSAQLDVAGIARLHSPYPIKRGEAGAVHPRHSPLLPPSFLPCIQ